MEVGMADIVAAVVLDAVVAVTAAVPHCPHPSLMLMAPASSPTSQLGYNLQFNSSTCILPTLSNHTPIKTFVTLIDLM
jgi:hypothetical protein